VPGLDEREYRMSQGHDSAAALVSDGVVVAAAAEERFNRKSTRGLSGAAIQYCLSEEDSRSARSTRSPTRLIMRRTSRPLDRPGGRGALSRGLLQRGLLTLVVNTSQGIRWSECAR